MLSDPNLCGFQYPVAESIPGLPLVHHDVVLRWVVDPDDVHRVVLSGIEPFPAALDPLESVATQHLFELLAHQLHTFDQSRVRRAGGD